MGRGGWAGGRAMSLKAARDALLASALAYAECTEDRTSKGDPALLGARLRICAKGYWRAVRSKLDDAKRDGAA